MFRTIKIGAIAAVAIVVGAHAAAAQTTPTQTPAEPALTWGIFRENAADISESLRNCWAQAMVSGHTINGEIMAQNLTERKAEGELQRLAKQGLCAAERSSTTWSARAQGHFRYGDSDGDGRSDDGAGGNGSRSHWSDAGRSGDDSDQ